MIVEPLALGGACRLRFAVYRDARGTFRRLFDREVFLERGLADCSLQISSAWNEQRGTLRGLHFQRAPHAENKLVSVLAGAIYDVIVDLREGSATRGQWHGEVLKAQAGTAMYVPKGFAHGYLTLSDDSTVLYQMDAPYVAAAVAGIAWDDPDLAITWPSPPQLIGDQDRKWGRARSI